MINDKERTLLITTALEETWDFNQPVLFLGEWCKLYNRKSVWEKLDSEVLKSPYCEEGKFFEAQEYTSQIYEQLLPMIANWLNKIHSTQKSCRYWRILIGPFLLWYIQTLYDRFLYLTKAYSFYPSIDVVGLSTNSYKTPVNLRDFVMLSTESDIWNLQLITQLLNLCFKPPISFREFDWEFENKEKDMMLERHKISNSFRQKIKRQLVKYLTRWYKHKFVGVCMGGFSKQDKFNMLLKSKGHIFFIEPCEDLEAVALNNTHSVDLSIRDGLASLLGSDAFSQVVLTTLKFNMPLRYIELYKKELARLGKCYPYNPKTIVSSIDWNYNDQFKLWGAEKAEEGVKLVGVQHGGGYGLKRYFSHELLERKNCDTFISSGWKDDDINIIPAPSFYLCRNIVKMHKRIVKNEILWVTTTMARYQCSMASDPDPGRHLSYLDMQYHLATNLKENIFSQVVMRLYPHLEKRKWWYEHLRLKDRLPSLNVFMPQSAQDFIHQLSSTKLLLIDNLNTTFSFGLAFNIPTIMFLDKSLWEIRSEAKQLIELLCNVGIYHTTPQSAAEMINKVGDDPNSWWNESSVQYARKEFCASHASVTTGWINDWISILQNL